MSEKNKVKKVQVLLSTYNGEKFLKKQINSILNQDYPSISILIRDDGSDDRTREIIKKYIKKYSNIKYYQGNNIGCVGSFFELINKAGMEYDYFAFCDQDDIWLSNKISRAIEKLDELSDNIKLYCSNLILVDENEVRYKKQSMEYKQPSFGNAIIENICTGCTMVINRELLTLVKNIDSHNIIMHDWWIYLVATCFGNVFFDKKSFVLYRQHKNNVIGSTNNFIEKNIRRIKRYQRNNISNQISYFAKVYGSQIQKQNRADIIVFMNYKKNMLRKLQLIFNRRIQRQNNIDNLLFKILFLLEMK